MENFLQCQNIHTFQEYNEFIERYNFYILEVHYILKHQICCYKQDHTNTRHNKSLNFVKKIARVIFKI